jgi:hypothetical protein
VGERYLYERTFEGVGAKGEENKLRGGGVMPDFVGKTYSSEIQLINTPSTSPLTKPSMALALAEAEAADPDPDPEINLDLVLDSPAKWHSIRPWHPRLALSVTEITSVSATFLISSLSSNILRHHDDFEPDDDDDIPTHNTDALSQGISVKVNGTPWRKCLPRLADDADEATIIIHGLLPGRHYDIELGIIPGDEKLKGQIVTESESTCPVSVPVFTEISFIDSG